MSDSISRRGVTAGLAGLVLARGIPAQAQESRPWLDAKLLAAAKKEGPLTVYSSTNEQEGLPLFKIFTDATGININYIRGNDASLISRIAIETRAKQPSFDIVHMTNAHKMPQQLLAQFDPSEAKHQSAGARSEPALVRRLRQLQLAGLQHQIRQARAAAQDL